ncbi:hypothetical protein E2C01_007403 [Portunus trituberculatus]|uniref:Uncharacterized protein n=1 Tax=Portunus trituberculatus TaxID=210409 RepID=A0A5B7D471_PORTR|nr:hypothetical protein [Portunus trituberculatus]
MKVTQLVIMKGVEAGNEAQPSAATPVPPPHLCRRPSRKVLPPAQGQYCSHHHYSQLSLLLRINQGSKRLELSQETIYDNVSLSVHM